MERGEQPIPPRTRVIFTDEANKKLNDLVDMYGTDWVEIASLMPWRTARQCREQWNNFLAPSQESTQPRDRMYETIYKLIREGRSPPEIRRQVYMMHGKLLNLLQISRMCQEWGYQERAIIPILEAPAARDPLPQAQPHALDPQPGDQLITDYQQWDQMDEQDSGGYDNFIDWFE